jgi:hypothetical protein
MITDTLRILSREKNMRDVARVLGIGEGDLSGRLDVLFKMGYLKKEESAQSAACMFCPSSSSCSGPAGFTLTQKGKRAAGL